MWARCAASGYLHIFDVYQGKVTGVGNDKDISGCGLGGNVVLKLCSTLPEKRNFKIFADNYFSNFTMIKELTQRDLFYVGTINSNRLHGAPLKSEKEMKAEGRGAFDCVVKTTTNISLVRWLGNKCVTVVSSYLGAESHDAVRRYDKKQKKTHHCSKAICHRRVQRVDGWSRFAGHDVLIVQVSAQVQRVVLVHLLSYFDHCPG